MQWLIDIVLEQFAGIIMMWYGKLADIPTGWILCDGTNGTPDMRDKFIYGAKQDLGDLPAATGEGALANSGGTKSHNHTASQVAHSHTIGPGFSIQSGANFDDFTANAQPSITVNSKTELPPWRALYFIMKT